MFDALAVPSADAGTYAVRIPEGMRSPSLPINMYAVTSLFPGYESTIAVPFRDRARNRLRARSFDI